MKDKEGIQEALGDLNRVYKITGGKFDIPLWEEWETVHIVLPHVMFFIENHQYDGGIIALGGDLTKQRYLGAEEIREGLKLAYKLQRPLTEDEIFNLGIQP